MTFVQTLLQVLDTLPDTFNHVHCLLLMRVVWLLSTDVTVTTLHDGVIESDRFLMRMNPVCMPWYEYALSQQCERLAASNGVAADILLGPEANSLDHLR